MQRESEGIVVPQSEAQAEQTNAVKNNAAGGKGPWGGHADGAGKREGMAGTTGPNDAGGDRPRDKVRELQRRLWAAAERASGRRFHALYDHVWRSDVILGRLGLELHPDKTRRVELYDGKQGFDFLGCHLHKRLSGMLLEKKGLRLYFLQRWPSQRAMQRIRQRVKELTPRSRCHADLRDVIATSNPALRGWGNYFRTGNAVKSFVQIDGYVVRRLRALRLKRKGRNLRPKEARTWTRDSFENLGLYRLRGTIRHPEQPPLWKEVA